MKAFLPLVCLLLILAGGCATRPPLTQQSLLEITPSSSTRAEVEQLLGPPDDAVTGSNRKTLTVYQDSGVERKFHLFKEEFDVLFLTVYFLFQPDGILEKKLVSETATTSKTKFGVRTIGKPIADAHFAQVVAKETRYEQAFNILGPPIGEALTLDGQIVREWVFVRQGMFSAAKAQVITAVFDYETDVVQEFIIKDDVPAEMKR